MNKELEMLDNLSKQEIIVKKCIGIYMDGSVQTMPHKTTVGIEFKGVIETLQQALQRLEAIDNANPSEALECLEYLGNEERSITESEPFHYQKLNFIYEEYFEPIKQALLKAQEQEKENADYKKLEDEIGCPLKVLFKALKNGIYKYMYFDVNNPIFRHFDELETDGEFLFFEYLNHDTYGQEENGDVYLKDYKKTWWLKEDRSE